MLIKVLILNSALENIEKLKSELDNITRPHSCPNNFQYIVLTKYYPYL